jgi:NitT/TauT family transport system substrate-binding protein
VVQQALTRRAALGGMLALPLVRSAAAEEPTKASIALLRLSSSGPIFIAQDKGWFKEAGLDLTMKDFQSAAQVPLAVVSGDADLGVTAFTAGFFNLAAKGGLKVVAAQSAERPGYQLNVIAVTNPAWEQGVRSVKDLAGKRVAVTTVGSSVHYSLEIVARKYGVDTKNLTIVALQSIPNMVAAFKGGQVDAAVFPITTFRQVESEGSGKPIAYVGDEVPWQLGAVFTSPKTIVERRPLVERFIVGYRRGAAAYHEAFGKRDNGKLVPGPNYDEMIGILSTALKQPPALVASGLPFIDPEGRLDVGDIYKQVAFWQSTGQVSRDADAKSFIDLSFVQGHFNLPK